MSFQSMLNDEVKTYTKTTGTPPRGDATWTLSETLQAAVHRLDGETIVTDSGKEYNIDLNVFVDATTALVGVRIKWESKIYEIVFIDDPMSRGHHKELKCIKLNSEDVSSYAG